MHALPGRTAADGCIRRMHNDTSPGWLVATRLWSRLLSQRSCRSFSSSEDQPCCLTCGRGRGCQRLAPGDPPGRARLPTTPHRRARLLQQYLPSPLAPQMVLHGTHAAATQEDTLQNPSPAALRSCQPISSSDGHSFPTQKRPPHPPLLPPHFLSEGALGRLMRGDAVCVCRRTQEKSRR